MLGEQGAGAVAEAATAEAAAQGGHGEEARAQEQEEHYTMLVGMSFPTDMWYLQSSIF